MEIFVGNLSFSVTEDELRSLFAPYGQVTSVKIITDRETGRSRGFGFVEMRSETDVKAAIDSISAVPVAGRKLIVNEAQPRSRGFGFVEMPGENTENSRGFGFVEMSGENTEKTFKPAHRGDKPHGYTIQSPTATIELTIDRDFDSFTETDESALLEAIRQYFGLQTPPIIVSKERGSIKVKLALDQEVAKKLFWAVKQGDFANFNVSDAKLLGTALADALVVQKTVAESYDVFLCYNSADKKEVKSIGEKLKAEGVLPWLDEWQLRPGLPWQRSLENQIDTINSAAVFVGKNGYGPWQDMEIAAFIREFVKRQCPVIPVILRSCKSKPELPKFLSGMMWVDFRRRKPEPLKQLIYGITGERRRVAVT